MRWATWFTIDYCNKITICYLPHCVMNTVVCNNKGTPRMRWLHSEVLTLTVCRRCC